jgi:hypothetical protein
MPRILGFFVRRGEANGVPLGMAVNSFSHASSPSRPRDRSSVKTNSPLRHGSFAPSTVNGVPQTSPTARLLP